MAHTGPPVLNFQLDCRGLDLGVLGLAAPVNKLNESLFICANQFEVVLENGDRGGGRNALPNSVDGSQNQWGMG